MCFRCNVQPKLAAVLDSRKFESLAALISAMGQMDACGDGHWLAAKWVVLPLLGADDFDDEAATSAGWNVVRAAPMPRSALSLKAIQRDLAVGGLILVGRRSED